MQFGIYLVLIFLFLSFTCNRINEIVPEPFMDEIFHFRQTLEFYKGNWQSWDPMITTPPGLYILSILYIKATNIDFNLNDLRLLNATISGVGIFLISKLIASSTKVSFPNERAFLVALLPNLFIFYGLYYTDSTSALLCLLAHYFLMEKWNFCFLCTATISLLFRQTNIIWVALFSIFDQISRESKGDFKLILKYNRYFLNRFGYSSIFLISIFGIGVHLNGSSIALGDKTNHAASLHLAQFFYCNTTIALFCWPFLNFEAGLKSLKVILFVSLLACFAIRFGTIEHPYLLLDDGRHWTNLIWNRTLKYEIVKYLLIPIHSTALVLISNALIDHGNLWVFSYFAACAIVLIPSPLIEPRYFILPLIFFILNCKITLKSRVMLQIAVFMTINVFIVGWFLYRPFVWPHLPETIQRRIW